MVTGKRGGVHIHPFTPPTPPHPLHCFLILPWPQTLAFYMEGTSETIYSLCLEKNTCKKRDWELPGALPPVKSPLRRSSSCLESGEPLPSEVEHPASHILPLPLSLSFSLPPTFHPVRVHRDSEGASEIYLYPVWRQHHKDFFPFTATSTWT